VIKKRRELLWAIGAGALVAPLALFAQPQGKIWRVGFLVGRRPVSDDTDYRGAFPLGMRELGYVEGKNLVIEWRATDGDYARLPDMAAELVRLKVDLIVAAGTVAINAARNVTTSIPIVMATAQDPISSGFVKSLAHPGGNITGLSNLASDLIAKHLEMLIGIVPKLSRVAVLVNSANSAHATILKNVEAAAQKIGVRISPAQVQTPTDIEKAFSTMQRENAGALIVAQDSFLIQQGPLIAALASKHRLPSIFSNREYAAAGGLMSYGQNQNDVFRRAAIYVDKILKGAKPADLPVEQPTKFELVINMKTAKLLGIKIPNSILVRADKVIE
jgi:putative tryptophan/tyrosine transport system substrate-binding protein